VKWKVSWRWPRPELGCRVKGKNRIQVNEMGRTCMCGRAEIKEHKLIGKTSSEEPIGEERVDGKIVLKRIL
jgi:hypothetical protein